MRALCLRCQGPVHVRNIRAVPLHDAEWACVKAVLDREVEFPRCGQDPELLNDVAQVFAGAMRPGELEALPE